MHYNSTTGNDSGSNQRLIYNTGVPAYQYQDTENPTIAALPPKNRVSKTLNKDGDYILILPARFLASFICILLGILLICLDVYYGIKIVDDIEAGEDVKYSVYALIVFGIATVFVLVYSQLLLYHKVLKINANRISYINRIMYLISDDAEAKGLGITIKNVDFSVQDLVGISIRERSRTKRIACYCYVKKNAFLVLNYRVGELRFGDQLDMKIYEAAFLLQEIQSFCHQKNIHLNVFAAQILY